MIDRTHVRDRLAHQEYSPALVLWECMPRARRAAWLIESMRIGSSDAYRFAQVGCWWELPDAIRERIASECFELNIQQRWVDDALFAKPERDHCIPDRELTDDALPTEYLPSVIVWRELQQQERREFLLLAGCTSTDIRFYEQLNWTLIAFQVRLRILRALYDWAQSLLSLRARAVPA